MNIAIIPARGGSKRIPRKNIKLFYGIPIIAYSIKAAQLTDIFDSIIVSTDDEEIADVARKYGAEVPFMRPPELADDFAGTDDVIFHALDWFKNKGNIVKYACCIYATAPFIKQEFIKKGLDFLCKKKAASAFSVTTFSYPAFRALQINEAGRIEMVWPEYLMSRSQDLPKTYHDAGQFYWVDVEKYYKTKLLFSNNSVPVILPDIIVRDIDTIEDWKAAELIYKLHCTKFLSEKKFDESVKKLGLRRIENKDIYNILNWRNHHDVRKNFFNTEPVTKKEHEKWFRKKINDINFVGYLAFYEEDSVGTIRFENGDEAIKVSIMVNPDFIGRGFGTRIISMGVEKFLEERKIKKAIVAEVKVDNIASIKAFQKSGFKKSCSSYIFDSHLKN